MGLRWRGFSRAGFPWHESCLCPRITRLSFLKPVKRPVHLILYTKKTFGRNLVQSYNAFAIIPRYKQHKHKKYWALYIALGTQSSSTEQNNSNENYPCKTRYIPCHGQHVCHGATQRSARSGADGPTPSGFSHQASVIDHATTAAGHHHFY